MRRLFALAGALAAAGCMPTQQQIAATDALAKAQPLDPALQRAIAVAVANERQKKLHWKTVEARISDLVSDRALLALTEDVEPHYCVQVETESPTFNSVWTYAVSVRQVGNDNYNVKLRWNNRAGLNACDPVRTGVKYRPFPELHRLLEEQAPAN